MYTCICINICIDVCNTCIDVCIDTCIYIDICVFMCKCVFTFTPHSDKLVASIKLQVSAAKETYKRD